MSGSSAKGAEHCSVEASKRPCISSKCLQRIERQFSCRTRPPHLVVHVHVNSWQVKQHMRSGRNIDESANSAIFTLQLMLLGYGPRHKGMRRARPAAVAPSERESGDIAVAKYASRSYGLCCSHLQVPEVCITGSTCDADTNYINITSTWTV